MKTLIFNGDVITPERIIKNGYVLIEDGKIIGVGENFDASGFDGEKIDANGKYIAPGFIDIHTHGAGGSDFMDGTEEAYIREAFEAVKFSFEDLEDESIHVSLIKLPNT